MKTAHNYLYAALALVISAGVFITYLSINRFGDSEIGGFAKTLEGTAFRPGVYRLLVPALARAGANVVPSRMVDFFRNLPPGTGIKQAFDQLSNGTYFGEAISALLLIYLSVAGFIFVEKRFVKELGYSLKEQLVLPIALAILILPFSVFFAYVYDLPEVFLFAICALFLYQRRWPAYLVFLAISLLNKETSAFLILIFAIYYFPRLPRREFITLFAAQAGIFVALRALIMYLYRDNPGVSIFWSLQYHIDQYTKYPSTLLVTLILFGVMAFLMLKDWQRKPVFLRYASLIFPLTLVLFFVAGMPMEFRIFLDSLPIFGIMLFPAPKPSARERVTPFLEHGIQSNP